MLVRLGQHREFTTNALMNLTPCCASRFRTFGIAHSVSERWSSVRMTTTFGGPSEGAADRSVGVATLNTVRSPATSVMRFRAGLLMPLYGDRPVASRFPGGLLAPEHLTEGCDR